jgi:hypothetical protein
MNPASKSSLPIALDPVATAILAQLTAQLKTKDEVISEKDAQLMRARQALTLSELKIQKLVEQLRLERIKKYGKQSETLSEGLAGVADIHQYAFHSRQIRPTAVDRLQGSATIGHLGSGNCDGMGQPLRIHPDVPFDAGHLLARIVSLLLSAIGVLHALRVNNQEAGHDVASLFGAGLAN